MSSSAENASTVERSFDLLKDYAETRITLAKLQIIRGSAKMTGYFVWLIITLVLVTLLIVFLGIVSGFWFSKMTGSYISGFAITAGIILLLIVLMTVLGRALFVGPVIRAFISRMMSEEKKPE